MAEFVAFKNVPIMRSSDNICEMMLICLGERVIPSRVDKTLSSKRRSSQAGVLAFQLLIYRCTSEVY